MKQSIRRVFSILLGTCLPIGVVTFHARGGTSLASETQPATAPSTSTQEFQDPAHLIRLQYPRDWVKKTDPDYVLWLANGPQLFTLDIPDLPPHIPGMIPLSLVVNGYIDDLKKSHPGVKTSEETAPQIPHARSRCVHSIWTEKGVPTSEIATLVVHGDHVFILRIVAPTEQLPAARDVYNAIIDSIRWTK